MLKKIEKWKNIKQNNCFIEAIKYFVYKYQILKLFFNREKISFFILVNHLPFEIIEKEIIHRRMVRE